MFAVRRPRPITAIVLVARVIPGKPISVMQKKARRTGVVVPIGMEDGELLRQRTPATYAGRAAVALRIHNGPEARPTNYGFPGIPLAPRLLEPAHRQK